MEVLKVSAKSSPNSVAGALAGVLRERGGAELQAIGAGALAATAATGILSDGFGGPGSFFKDVPGLAPPDPPENPRS